MAATGEMVQQAFKMNPFEKYEQVRRNKTSRSSNAIARDERDDYS